MFKKSYISFLAILFFVSGLSAVPNMLNYRGKLFESGMPANGNRTVTFRIYDQLTLGTLLWNSGPIGIDVNNGYYHYTMTVPSVLFGTNNDLYLDVDIGGSSLVPRERLVAVGYALNADMVDGMHASDLGAWKKTGADIYYTNGNVGIGILNPIFQLDIQGTNRMTAFRMEPGAGSSRVLTSDAAGNGSWQSLSGLGAISGSGTGNYIPRFGIGSTISNSMIYQDNNRIRISDSTTAPTSTLYVSSTNSDVSGVDGIFVDIQNRNTTLKVMNGVRFWNGTTANTFKGAIYYQDEKGYGVGNMIFANNINSAAAGNATISDARMVISTNGAIGIGTLSPARALHLYNNSFMVGPVNDRSLEVDSKDIYLGDIDGGSMNNYLFIDAEGSGDFLFLRGNHVGINTNKPSAKLHIVNSLAEDSFRVDDQAGGDTTPFVIDGSGNVGVGTNKPNRVVELRNGWPYVRFADTDGGNYWEAGARGDQNRFLIAEIVGGAPMPRFGIYEGGSVIIGSTLAIPTALLDVRGSAVFNEDGDSVDFRIEGDTQQYLFFTDGSADKVAIGTGTPDADSILTVIGRITVDGSYGIEARNSLGLVFKDYDGTDMVSFLSGNLRIINNPGTGTTASNYLYQGSSGSTSKQFATSIRDAFWVDSAYIYFDKITGTASYNLVRINTADGRLYYDTSTRRNKSDIKIFHDDFKKIMSVEPKIFVDKTSGEKNIGYIAEEFNDLGLKYLVTYDRNGEPNGLHYERIPLYMLEIIKEHHRLLEYYRKTVNVPDKSDGTSFLQFNKNGCLGIGVKDPDHPLQLRNGAYLSKGGVWMQASSREYKKNIRDLSEKEAFAVLKDLRPRRFKYKNDPSEEYLGFISEEVPDLAAVKDKKGLNAMDMVAVLTKVVQHQQKEIEILQKEINQIKKQ